jgi:hypothetical protein
MLQNDKHPFAFWQKSSTLLLLFLFTTLQVLHAEKIPITASFLMPDGSINRQKIGNQQLSFDVKGWRVELDADRGPVFYPAPVPNTWNSLSQGVNNWVFALAVSGSDVYVGGVFTAVGGGTAVSGLNNIAKWNGTTWSALGQGLNGAVYDITVSGSTIYAGGDFTAVGGGTAVAGLNRIAKWDGSAWSALGQGLNNGVSEIVVNGSELLVGGNFTNVGGGTAVAGLNNIAKWNGTTWSALGQGLNQSVNAIAILGSDIYVGGNFTNVGGGSSVNGLGFIAKWSGGVWSDLDFGLNNTVNALLVIGTDLYVGGWFTGLGSGDPVPGINYIAKWNGTAWSALGLGLNNVVFALTAIGTDVYVGGQFTGVGGGTAVSGLNGIAKWSSSTWSALDMGLNNIVYDVAAGSSDLFAGGTFDMSVGTPINGLNYVARWELTPTNPIVYTVTGGGSYCSGSAGVAVGLSNSESGVSYQLKRDNMNVGSPMAGTGLALSFGLQTLAGTYTVAATKGVTTLNMSGNAVVSVETAPTIISGIQPAVVALCLGTVQTLTASANGANLMAEWQRKAAGAANFSSLFNVNLANSNAVAYTLPPAMAADNGASYRVIFKNACGSMAATDAVLTVSNTSPPQVGISPQTQRVCAFNNFSLSLSGTTASSVVKWQIGLILTNQQIQWYDITGSANKLVHSSIAPVKTSKFRAVINSATCGLTYSAEATVETCVTFPFGSSQAVIYPNPTIDVLNLRVQSELAGAAQIVLTDLTGRTLMRDSWALDKGDNFKSFDTQSLVPSVYFLSLYTVQRTPSGGEEWQKQVLKFIKK